MPMSRHLEALATTGPEPPVLLVCFEGTNTRYAPDESMYRYGFSSDTGVFGTTVYGGFGNVLPGAPCS